MTEAVMVEEKEPGRLEVENIIHDAAASDDVHDPLNWSTTQKIVLLMAMNIWIFIGPANILINGGALSKIAQELSVPVADTSYLVGGASLAYGLGSFVWVAFANRWGVRLTFILCAFAAGLLSIWGARATNFGSLIGARILASLFFSSPEVLGLQVIGDVFFLKDRAKAVTILLICQGSGFMLGPLIGAYIYSFTSAFLYPFPYMLHPVVMIATFWFAICLVTANYLLTVMTISFEQTYGFNIKASGLANIAPTLGIVVSIFVSGYLADAYEMRNLRIAAKSGKKPNPETRLLLLVIPGTIGVAGTLLFGVCTQNKCHWIGPMAGAFGNLFSFVGGLGILYAYFLDVHEARTDAVLVIFNGIKNFAGFGITYAVFPWTASSGFTIPFVVLAMILLAAHIPMAALYFIGPGVRRWAAANFVTGRPSQHGDAF